jgi:hypothetical protein
MIDLDWDPEVESPATIAVIGGGPMGIETAIYGRFLGYFVSIIEERRVAHRMLDWHDRPLDVEVQQCTTTLGHAAILSQYPEYVRRAPTDRYTGRTYADEYLLPLAKTDLLFDDIHFLSPVSDVSRLQTHIDDAIVSQERCNDEFRIVVQGRHRGTWISRADVVIDCRGQSQKRSGIGPGGGQAIGESELKDAFLKHTPLDRKFEAKQIAGKRICLVGQSVQAAQFAMEFLQHTSGLADTRLHWIVRPDHRHDSTLVTKAIEAFENASLSNAVVIESLGVEQMQRTEAGAIKLKLLSQDDTAVELECDAIAPFTHGRSCNLTTELDERPLFEAGHEYDFVTREPGFYRLRGGNIEDGAGVGLADGFERIRRLFAMLSGREDLDLYEVLARG